MEDYEKTFHDFWESIVTRSDGTWNSVQVMKELYDYYMMMTEASKVYYEVTDGRISKPNTAAFEVIGEYNTLLEKYADEIREEVRSEYQWKG